MFFTWRAVAYILNVVNWKLKKNKKTRWSLPCKQRMELDAGYLLLAHSLTTVSDWNWIKKLSLIHPPHIYVSTVNIKFWSSLFFPNKKLIVSNLKKWKCYGYISRIDCLIATRKTGTIWFQLWINSESTLNQWFVRFVHIAERPSSTGPNVLTMQIDNASQLEKI